MRNTIRLSRSFLCSLLLAAMLLCFGTAASADAETGITLSSSSLAQGSSVSLYLGVENSPGISAMDIYLRYDSDALSFLSAAKYSLGNSSEVLLLCSENEPGLIHLMLVHGGTGGFSGTGKLVSLTFAAQSDAACTSYPVELIVNDVLNTSDQPLSVSAGNGSLQVTERSTDTVYLYGSLSASTVNVGDELQFSVYAYNLYDLSCVKFNIIYDDAMLELKEPVQPGSVFGSSYYDINQTGSGLLSVSVISSSGLGVSTTKKTLLTLCFTAKAAGTVQLNCSAEQAFDGALNALSCSSCSAEAKIVQPSVPVTAPVLQLSSSSEELHKGDSFDLTLKLSVNSRAAALLLSVAYNGSVLRCDSFDEMETGVGQLALADSSESGKVNFSYIGPELEEETVLLTLHMTALAAVQTAQTATVNVQAATTGDYQNLTPDTEPLSFTIAAPRIHGDWIYSAEGAVLSARCGHELCDHEETVTLSITDGSYIYDGEAKEPAVLTYTEGFPQQSLTVDYADNVNAGTATASVTCGTATASAAFEIGKAEQCISAEAEQNFTYGDTGSFVSASALGGAVLSFAVTSGNSAAVDASTGALTISETGDTLITVTAPETENYSGAEKLITVRVAAKILTRPTAAEKTYTYDGTEQSFALNDFDAETMDISGHVQTDANEEGYTVSVSPKKNYCWDAEGECSFTWIIRKAEPAEAQKTLSAVLFSAAGSTAELVLCDASEQAQLNIKSMTGISGVSSKTEGGRLLLTVEEPIARSLAGFTVVVEVSQCKNYRDHTIAVNVAVKQQSVELGQASLTDESVTAPLTLAFDAPTEVSFIVACYDADHKMLGFTVETATLSGATEKVTLDLPEESKTAALGRLMVLDSEGFFPLGRALLW